MKVLTELRQFMITRFRTYGNGLVSLYIHIPVCINIMFKHSR